MLTTRKTRLTRAAAAVTTSIALLAAPALLARTSASAAPAATQVNAAPAGPYCGLTWGSLDQRSYQYGPGELSGIRAGRHACFDRLVLDLTGDPSIYHVGYVDYIGIDLNGKIPIDGGAVLQLDVQKHAPTNPDEPDVAGYRTFRDVEFVSSFEGFSTVGLGVRARLPFRTFWVDGPGNGTRLVVDVAHRW